MPYIRVHIPKASIEQRRSIAQKLIEITLRTFQLRDKDRYNISVEFISGFRVRTTNVFLHPSAGEEDLMVEVMGHDIAEAKKRAFSKEVAAMLAEFRSVTSKVRVARLLGMRTEQPKIAFQFGELNPAISEPFVVHSSSQAA